MPRRPTAPACSPASRRSSGSTSRAPTEALPRARPFAPRRRHAIISLLAALLLAAAAPPAQADARREHLRSSACAPMSKRWSASARATRSPRRTIRRAASARRGAGARREFRADRARPAAAAWTIVAARDARSSGDRIPTPVRLVNVVADPARHRAAERGGDRPGPYRQPRHRRDGLRPSDAPGANDNASGSALVLEAARVLSQQRVPDDDRLCRCCRARSRGCYGGKLLADYAAAAGLDGQGGAQQRHRRRLVRLATACCDAAHVRVFSEGPRADLTDAAARRAAPQRRRERQPGPQPVALRRRARQRHGGPRRARRSGAPTAWAAAGTRSRSSTRAIPAVRFSVAIEDYEHQHQDLRVENGVTLRRHRSTRWISPTSPRSRGSTCARSPRWRPRHMPPGADGRGRGAVPIRSLAWNGSPRRGASYYDLAATAPSRPEWTGVCGRSRVMRAASDRATSRSGLDRADVSRRRLAVRGQRDGGRRQREPGRQRGAGRRLRAACDTQ